MGGNRRNALEHRPREVQLQHDPQPTRMIYSFLLSEKSDAESPDLKIYVNADHRDQHGTSEKGPSSTLGGRTFPLASSKRRRALRESATPCVTRSGRRDPGSPPGAVTQFERVRGRFVRTIKELCVERFILIGEGSLRRCGHRVRRPLPSRAESSRVGNRLIVPPATAGRMPDPIHCRHRLGGMLKYYYRAAA